MKRLKSYAFLGFMEHFTHNSLSTLHLLSKIYYRQYNVLNDRFNLLNDSSEYILESRCDNIEDVFFSKNMTFDECCNSRSDEIIKLAHRENKRIYVLYSGGVDSSVVVSSFIMNDRLDKNSFYVVCNRFAIEENPYMYDFLVRNKINIYHINDDIETFISMLNDDGVYFVSGCCGDQIVSSNLHTRKYRGIDYFCDWKDALNSIVNNLFNKQVEERHIHDICKYAKHMKFPLKYFGDFALLFNFGLKWDYSMDYIKNLSRYENVVPFFDTIAFQKYMYNAHNMMSEYKHQNDYLYKVDFKKYIFSCTKSEEYFLNKGKSVTYIGDHHANPGLTYCDTSGRYRIKLSETTPDVIYKTMIKYIKPEYRDYYKVIKV